MRSDLRVLLFSALSLPVGLISQPIASQATVDSTLLGPPGAAVQDLAVDPGDPRIVYAGTAGGGVFKSVDGGATWSAASRGLVDHRILALAIDPHAPATLYAATASGVYKSIDGGVSWTRASRGLPAPPPFCGCGSLLTVFALAVDRSGVVYAGGSGVSKSVDGGSHWGPATAGLSLGVVSLAIDPLDQRTLYAGTSQGVYKSRNRGASWSPAAVGGGPPAATALALDPRVPGTLYAGTVAGVYKSTDGGAHWRTVNRGLAGAAVFDFALQAAAGPAPSVLYAGTSRGVYKSLDRAEHWTPAGSGLPPLAIAALGADPRTPGVLWAGAAADGRDGSGLFKTTNAGGLWQVSNHGLFASRVDSVAVDPLHPQTVFTASNERGVFRTFDGGATWAPANRGLPQRSVQALALDATAPALYAGMLDGVFKSTDEARSWEARNAGLIDPDTAYPAAVTALAFDPQDSQTLYAAGPSGLYVSRDGAASWNRLNPPVVNGHQEIRSVAVDPANSSLLLAGNLAGLFRSADGGVTWSQASLAPQVSNLAAFAFDPGQPGLVYAAWKGGLGGILRSEDFGATWADISIATGLSLPLAASDLAVDSTGTVYAAISLGVYRSTDHGATWSPFLSYGVPVNDVELSPGTLYAAVAGGGVQTIAVTP